MKQRTFTARTLMDRTVTIEGAICTSVPASSNGSAANPCNDILAAETASIADIEKLMEELRIARDYLKAEGQRVRGLTGRYVHLATTASASVRVISESLGKWRNCDPEAVSEIPGQSTRAVAEAAASLPRVVFNQEKND
jgi:hypothetical protein